MPAYLHALVIYLISALIAGWIAYLGNQVGRKIGRKKMSVLGMRPRHTSIFITTLTGSLIAVITLTLFAIFSEPVREILRGTRALEERLSILQQEVAIREKQLREGRIVWGIGSPILLGTLNPALSSEQLRAQINAALSAANSLSIARNNEIASQMKEPPLAPDTQLLQSEPDNIDNLLQELSTASNVTGLRVVAAKNCLYKDEVPVHLETMPVTRIFREGEEVASRSVNPNNPQLLLEWYGFLEEMKIRALRKGMIQINDSLGGEITGDAFLQMVAELSKLKGQGRLVAVANRDLYQTSRLDVRIEVKPGNMVGQR